MIKTKKMRRKIPMLHVSVENGADYSQLTEIPEVRESIMKETLCAIKEGIKKNRKTISLFEVAHSDCYIELDKTKWKSTLEKALDRFIEIEDYTQCVEMRDLISKL